MEKRSRKKGKERLYERKGKGKHVKDDGKEKERSREEDDNVKGRQNRK